MTKKTAAKKALPKKTAKKKVGKRAQTKPSAIRKSHIKEYIKSQGNIRLSTDALDGLSKTVEALCDKAIERAKDNGRQTIRKQDF